MLFSTGLQMIPGSQDHYNVEECEICYGKYTQRAINKKKGK